MTLGEFRELTKNVSDDFTVHYEVNFDCGMEVQNVEVHDKGKYIWLSSWPENKKCMVDSSLG